MPTRRLMSNTQVNKVIYDSFYTPENLRLKHEFPYESVMQEIRFSYLHRYGSGRVVLDLCCGSGEYLVPLLATFRQGIGLDFSAAMLQGLRDKFSGPLPENLTILEADATDIPLPAASIDFVCSYAALYHVENIDSTLREISRVLQPGGHAALELGNLFSLNTIVAAMQHRRRSWARPYHIPTCRMLSLLESAGLEIREWRSFQILPMYGVPLPLLFLYPLLSSLWKRVLGIRLRGRMLDEYISSAPGLRHLAFRHLFLVRKKPHLQRETSGQGRS